MATSITLTLTEAEARRLVDVNLVNDFTDAGRALRNRLIASLPPVPVKCPVCYRSGSFTTTQNALIAHLVHDHHYEDDRDWYREESAQTYAWRAFHKQTYCPVQGHHLNH